MKPSPDNGPTPNKTYVEDPESMDGMPEDDFGPTNRSGTGVDDDGQEFPFREPAIGPDSAEDGVEDPPIAVPIEEEALPGADITVCSPVRRRTFAQARYRVPRVARMHVQPQTVPWLTPQESRLANR